MTATTIRDVLIAAWGAAGLVLAIRRPKVPLGPSVMVAAAVCVVGTISSSLAAVVLGVLPAVGLHVLLGMPDGRLVGPARRMTVAVGYAAGLATALYLWSRRPDLPAAPVALLGV